MVLYSTLTPEGSTLAGCDQWLATVVDDINAALGTTLRFETVETLPGGAGQCLRKFWVER